MFFRHWIPTKGSVILTTGARSSHHPHNLKHQEQRDHPGPSFTSSNRAARTVLLAVIHSEVAVPSRQNLCTYLKICRAAKMDEACHWECTDAQRREDALERINHSCKELFVFFKPSKLYSSSFYQAKAQRWH